MPTHADFQEKTARGDVQPLVAGPLDPYVPSVAKPWDARRVAHLYRRLGYGATQAQIAAGLQMSPSDLVDQLLDDAANLGTPAPPYWAGYTAEDYNNDPNPDLVFEHYGELRRRWIADLMGPDSVRAKFAFFWHNHFVTTLNVVGCSSYLWSYYSLLHEFSLGNFRTFAREMGQNPAMLVYLNGNQSIAAEPNENYARELLELFTLGENNGYTQIDIVEMSRALTGWRAPMYECTPAFFEPALHDNQPKTIFGQTQNFGFATAHNLIFTQRATQSSEYIVGKVYKNYVYQKLDNEVVQTLAQTFRSSNWELLPMLKQLFKSEHFFDERVINARIKNPFESMLPLFKMAGATYPEHITDDWLDAFSYWAYELGQEILNPPNVAGWPGYHAWINESTLTGRWTFSSYTVYLLSTVEPLRENLRGLAQTLTNDSNDPAVIVPALIQFFTGQTLDPIYQQAAVVYFKSGIPENYFADGSWNLYWDEAPYQVVNMLYFLVRMPEFQLM
jgi:uncharacterized protein (DUF1800 family)